jgi:sulfate permease, SulP family
MSITFVGRQISTGIIVGLSAVIYGLSYGALLFSGSLSLFVGFGITVALVTAAIGCLFGSASQEGALISGPDSNSISVLASMLAVIGTMGLQSQTALSLAVATIFLTSVLSAIIFYAVGRADLSMLVRYIPYPVMAGFLSSTGWLMVSGALNIISATPLSRAGLENFLADPVRPELGFGLLIAVILQSLIPRVSSAVLIPAVMIVATLLVNFALGSEACTNRWCETELWLFPHIETVQWLPPWKIDWSTLDADFVIQSLPAMLVVGFVGLLTILLSMASLELSFQKEFELNAALKK